MSRAAFGACCLTLQSISEFYAVVTRKGMMRPDEAVTVAEAMLELYRTAAPSPSAFQGALRLAAACRASYWDALLVHTAAEAGCTAILTEDLADGASLGGIQVINPFAGAALSPAAEALLTAN
jgi:predicted nucleic acid-binding protein